MSRTVCPAGGMCDRDRSLTLGLGLVETASGHQPLLERNHSGPQPLEDADSAGCRSPLVGPVRLTTVTDCGTEVQRTAVSEVLLRIPGQGQQRKNISCRAQYTGHTMETDMGWVGSSPMVASCCWVLLPWQGLPMVEQPPTPTYEPGYICVDTRGGCPCFSLSWDKAFP